MKKFLSMILLLVIFFLFTSSTRAEVQIYLDSFIGGTCSGYDETESLNYQGTPSGTIYGFKLLINKVLFQYEGASDMLTANVISLGYRFLEQDNLSLDLAITDSITRLEPDPSEAPIEASTISLVPILTYKFNDQFKLEGSMIYNRMTSELINFFQYKFRLTYSINDHFSLRLSNTNIYFSSLNKNVVVNAYSLGTAFTF